MIDKPLGNGNQKRILVSGATGYIGGRLVTRLLEGGYRVRAIGRSMDKLRSRSWSNHPDLEAAQVDLLDSSSVILQAKGCHAGFYLIPSTNPLGRDFTIDYQIAKHFSLAATQAGWRQLVYLKGLPRREGLTNPYLLSRWQVESILRSGETRVTSFHTDIVYGCGSVTFETIRSLFHGFRLIHTQRWMLTPCRPIALPNIVEYLAKSIDNPETIDRSFDVGGPEWTTYRQMMAVYAEQSGFHRFRFLHLPILTSRLGAYLIHLLTPIPAKSAYMLIANLSDHIDQRDEIANEIISVDLLNVQNAMSRFIQHTKTQTVETHWTDAGVTPPADWLPESSAQGGERKLYQDQREIRIKASQQNVWQSLVRIGGKTGWYYGNILWKLRGVLDRLVGGVGLKRGRRHPEELRPGDALDLWRARIVDAPSRLMLVAEMRLPGKAILDFQIKTTDQDQIVLQQSAWYEAHGLLGILYWYSVLPFHAFIFQGMIEGIAKATRLSYRYSFHNDIRIKIGQLLYDGTFINISRGGCKVFSPSPATRNDHIELILLPPYKAGASVRFIDQYRVRDGYHLSMKFHRSEQGFENWLDQLLQSFGNIEEIS